MIRKYLTRRNILIIIGILFLLYFLFCLPDPLFRDPTSTVLVDKDKNLLGARIADDGQWRFPSQDTIPEKFRKAILYFEDEYFYRHPGVNPVSLFRAAKQNIKAKRIVSGGSTITMQVIRLSRKGKPRTIWQKLIECIWSLRAEIRYSKDEVLALYCANAPFGGNVVGLEAASWRYFRQNPENLSWAEAATLAVLPNAPSLIHPGKNRELLRKKRDFLLQKLKVKGVIDEIAFELAIDEPLPDKPFPIYQDAIHLLNRGMKEGYKGLYMHSTLDGYLQSMTEQTVNRHSKIFKSNEINNAAAIILDVETGNVLAYVGNSSDDLKRFSNEVDVIDAPRSTGSILKPLLYASMLMDGEILPYTLVPDIPTYMSGYTPQNFNRTFDGAVPADEALYRSLNIPAVRMLRDYGIEKFHHKLVQLEMSTITKSPDHYGLSLILGGAEAKLWEIAGCYASMARTLNHFYDYSSKYNLRDFHAPNYIVNNTIHPAKKGESDLSIFDAASIWQTFEVLTNVNRPFQETGWESYISARNIAWKTGTSFGFRDGWAIGITPKYVVGVWVGNATGEGRPNLTGLTTAGPLMFDILNLLPTKEWFQTPYDELVEIPVCSKSGYRASQICDQVDTVLVPIAGLETGKCPFHKIIHLDNKGYRVTSECRNVFDMDPTPWFILPPVQEWYYKFKHSDYKTIPPYAPDCRPQTLERAMEIIYPKNMTRIYIPIDLDGSVGRVVFKVAHRKPQTTIYWHIDDEYKGSTSEIHEMSLLISPGEHLLTLVDEKGESITKVFEILGKN